MSGLGFLFRGFKSKLMLDARLGFDDLTPENRSAEGILRNRISELDLGSDLLDRRVIRVRRFHFWSWIDQKMPESGRIGGWIWQVLRENGGSCVRTADCGRV